MAQRGDCYDRVVLAPRGFCQRSHRAKKWHLDVLGGPPLGKLWAEPGRGLRGAGWYITQEEGRAGRWYSRRHRVPQALQGCLEILEVPKQEQENTRSALQTDTESLKASSCPLGGKTQYLREHQQGLEALEVPWGPASNRKGGGLLEAPRQPPPVCYLLPANGPDKGQKVTLWAGGI